MSEQGLEPKVYQLDQRYIVPVENNGEISSRLRGVAVMGKLFPS
jgi:hypothetical protein